MSLDTLTGMRVFTTVVDLGSFARAADKLDLSRGMVSRHVAAVEERLRARLLNRTTRRLSVTEAGRDYYQRALEILALVERAEHAVGESEGRPRGTLRVTAPVAFGRRMLGAVTAAYLGEYPGVKLDLSLGDRVVDLAEEGVDLAIRITQRVEARLIARPLANARLAVCAAPAYLARHGAPRTPAELADHNCLTYAYAGSRTTWRLMRDGREVAVQVSSNYRCNNGELLAEAAIAGAGVVFLPSFMVDDALRDGRLVPLIPQWAAEPLRVYAVYENRDYLPPKVRTFIDFLATWFARGPAI